MTDIMDRAQVAEEFRRDLAVRAVRSGAAQLATPRAFGLCDDCTDPIDAERRKANPTATRCIDCQEAFERLAKTLTR